MAIQVDADVLLVDEVLAVGDASFQQKRFDVFYKMRDEGRTIVFVTHDMGSLKRFCDRALLLERGEMVHHPLTLAPPLHTAFMSDVIPIHGAARIRFARSATRHRISRDRIRHAIANHRVRLEEPPPERLGRRSIRIVYLDENPQGHAIEVMAVALDEGGIFVIHAMPLRKRHRTRYREPRP